jgi:hypothetical protein
MHTHTHTHSTPTHTILRTGRYRVRSRCVDCGGKGICEHKRIKRQCKVWLACYLVRSVFLSQSLCVCACTCMHVHSIFITHHHFYLFSPPCTCTQECGGSSICEHKRQKSSCKECKGSSLCPHGTRTHREIRRRARDTVTATVTVTVFLRERETERDPQREREEGGAGAWESDWYSRTTRHVGIFFSFTFKD